MYVLWTRTISQLQCSRMSRTFLSISCSSCPIIYATDGFLENILCHFQHCGWRQQFHRKPCVHLQVYTVSQNTGSSTWPHTSALRKFHIQTAMATRTDCCLLECDAVQFYRHRRFGGKQWLHLQGTEVCCATKRCRYIEIWAGISLLPFRTTCWCWFFGANVKNTPGKHVALSA